MKIMTEYPNLDSKIPLNFFSAPHSKDKKNRLSENCSHLGFLVKDGHNKGLHTQVQRVKCAACQKRFGNNASIAELYTYQTQMQQLIYDIFFARINQKELESRWHIPQSMISKFKKSLTTQLLQEPEVFTHISESWLPNGVLMADETFMGCRGNSNVEINMVNQNFQTIASGSATPGELQESIRQVYLQIPEAERNRLRVLITDGEPAYEFIPLEAGGRIVHLQQLHAKKLLGKVIVNKYEKFGPHHLHYILRTNWKIFKQDDPCVTIEWEIKFIKGISRTGRGRPTLKEEHSRSLQLWRRKKDEYYSDDFAKEGKAIIFINKQTGTISKKAGACNWMVNMLTPLLKIFNGKYITNNQTESKHSQIKRKGASRKQKDVKYADNLFRLCAYFAEQKKLPHLTLSDRPLFHYLIKPRKKQKDEYVIHNKDSNLHQITLSTYIE
jgi:hypothetical protein